jgi:hypothetical protein
MALLHVDFIQQWCLVLLVLLVLLLLLQLVWM